MLAQIRSTTTSTLGATTVVTTRVALVCATALAVAMTLLVVAAPQADAKHRHAQYAETSKPDGKLKRGCKNYRYRYEVTPPEEADSWGLETFLVDRTGERIASGGVLSGEPEKGRETLRFCRQNTVKGKFKLAGKYTYVVKGEIIAGWIKPTRFRLR